MEEDREILSRNRITDTLINTINCCILKAEIAVTDDRIKEEVKNKI